MAKFIGNDIHSFDVEKIVIVWWRCSIDEYAKDVANIIFIDGTEVYLHYDCEDDLTLINQLKELLHKKSEKSS